MRKLFPTLLAGFLALVQPLAAETFDTAARSAADDLQAALKELAGVHEQIAAEKIPLARRVNELEERTAAKRREFDRAQRLRDNQAFDLNALKAQVKARHDENSYVSSLLGEYARVFETRIHISELQRYRDTIESAKILVEETGDDPALRYAPLVAAINASLDRLDNVIGGENFEGRALSASGVAVNGRFALIGPVALFASGSGDIAGIADLQAGSLEAMILDPGDAHRSGIRDVVMGGAGEFPFDPTLGNALKIASTRENLFQHMRKGGIVMVPIVLLALAAFVVGILKWLQLSRIRVPTGDDLQFLLDQVADGRESQALDRAASINGPAGELLALAVRQAGRERFLLEEILYEKVLQTRPRLERFLPFIALTAATAPLLGLLGTVTGMINTFKMITIFGTGDPRLLSSGISEALITTEFGLIIAVAALLAHAMLSRKAKSVLAGMEQIAVGFVNGMAAGQETAAGDWNGQSNVRVKVP